MPKTTKRCDRVQATILITEYDEHGRPVDDLPADPIIIYRAKSPDFWAHVDTLLQDWEKRKAAQAAQLAAAGAGAVPGPVPVPMKPAASVRKAKP